jgi:poly-gamma-glutamate capsule biosynthesis protein CapA/YwtB (metallophosphatase superfamily)
MGILGYYWNRRTAARAKLPGSARDLPYLVERDIEALRQQVDKIIVTVHWGVPYERLPSKEDRIKARHFIDCGADVVAGHHPHIIQPVEIYRGRPIFYSLGNFAFGSGNSKAEALLLGLRFVDEAIEVDVYPVYVKHRDPRAAYQPKIMTGSPASQTLRQLMAMSGEDGKRIIPHEFFGCLCVV